MNGLMINCATGGGTATLPPIRAGGYCMQASAGLQPYAYFTTY